MIPNQNDMHPVLLDRFLKAKFIINEQIGHKLVLTSVARNLHEQEALYAQHRNPLTVVNAYRQKAEMPPITERENSYCVTWTMLSKHLLNADGKSRAFDYALLIPGKKVITWDTKWDEDHDGVPEYLECAKVFQDCGLVCGAFWKAPKTDIPHVQLPDDVL
jgi:hypothetical protein